jgi:hypothetical protein
MLMQRTETVVGQIKLLPAFPKLDLSKIDVWSQKALEDANKQADEAQKLIVDLTHAINRMEQAKISEEWRQKLIDRPKVAQALKHLQEQNAK